ncbi:MBL fold metallo-hydrolase [Rhodococcus indonesiensis]
MLRLGDTDWQVLHTPGHTAGHLALWQPDNQLLVVGDALSFCAPHPKHWQPN